MDSDNRIRSGTSLKIQSAKSREYLSTKADQEWTGGVQGGGERSNTRAGARPKPKNSIDDLIGEVETYETPGIVGTRNKGKRTGIYHPLDDDELYNCRNNVIELSKKASDEDAFLITSVDELEVKDLLFIQTVSAQLYRYTKYLRANRMDEIDKDTYTYIKHILTQLIFLVTNTDSTDAENCEGYPIKSRQKLMRELRVVELLVDCLYYPFYSGGYTIEELTDEMPLKKICILCYRLILHCVKDYRLNELYASQWIELYFEQSMASVETNIKAENTIAVLVSNNRTLLEKQITSNTIEKFISLCKEQKKDERFVLLLTALCSCMGEAITSNQNDIIRILLEDEEYRNILVFPLKQRNGVIQIRIKDTKDEPEQWVALKELKEYSGSHDGMRIYKYFCAFIDLIAELCLDRNHRALNYLIDIYPLDIVLKALMHSDLDHGIKSKFVKLMEHMYVNKDPFNPLKVPNFTRIWNEISMTGNKIQYFNGELPEYIQNLKEFVIQYLKDTKGVQSIFDSERNQMSLQVIKLVKLMVSYGFYKTKDELREVSVALISLLNGTDDVYDLQQNGYDEEEYNLDSFRKVKALATQFESTVRYQKSEDNIIIMNCKEQICDTLLKILDIENDLKMSLFLGFFKDEIESQLIVDIDVEDQGFTEHLNSSKVMPKELLKKDEDNTKGLLSSNPKPNNTNDDIEAVNWIEKVLMGEQLFDAYPQTTYVCLLMDLLAYDHMPLNNKSFDLLNKFFNQRIQLIELLKQIQLLEHPESIKNLKKVTKIIIDLKVFNEILSQWMDNSESNQYNLNDLSVKMLASKEYVDYMASILVEKQKKNRKAILEQYYNNNSYEVIPKTGRTENDSLVIGLNGNIKRRGELKSSELLPNQENQRLLRNLGVQNIVVQLLKTSVSDTLKDNEDYTELIKAVYLFLIRFCKDNIINQNLLGEHVEYFSKELDTCSLAIFLIKEIFKNNQAFLTTKAQRIIKFVVQREEDLELNSPEKHHYLNILKAFAKCKNKIVKKNQNEILLYIAKKDEGTICSLFNTQEGRAKARVYLSEFGKSVQDGSAGILEVLIPPEIYNMVCFMDLICICCDGKNEVAESRAQQSVLDMAGIYEFLQMSENFIPLKKTIVEYFYHTWIIIGKRDLYEEVEYTDLLWKITELLVADLENKVNSDERENKARMYGQPLSQTFKIVSDNYIYKAVFLALTAVLKLNLKFEEKEELLQKIAQLSCELYYRVAKNQSYKRGVLDVIMTMYNSAAFTKYLDGIKHPLLEDEQEVQDADSDGEDTSKVVQSTRAHTVWFNGVERTRASIYYQKLSAFAKNEEMIELLEHEFEKMIIWFSNFSDNCEHSFVGLDPIIHLFNILDPENSALSGDLNISGLKILRKIIETANKNLLTPSAEWDTDDWEH